MKVRSNKIIDIIKHYELMLTDVFDNQSSKQLLRELISHYIEIPYNEISLYFDKRISESQLLDIHFGVKRLLSNEPIQYIIGKTEFLDIVLYVNKDTLIPRPETEELVILIEQEINKNKRNNISILDIGTGSGCIAISLQKTFNIDTLGIDFSKEALQMAIKNAKFNKAKVDFRIIDILSIEDRDTMPMFDLIISNPPYVQDSEKELMHKNVLDFEPESALFVDNENPLIYYNAIAEFAKSHLNNNGVIWLEINEYLAKETSALFESHHFCNIEIISDFRDKSRFIRIEKATQVSD